MDGRGHGELPYAAMVKVWSLIERVTLPDSKFVEPRLLIAKFTGQCLLGMEV